MRIILQRIAEFDDVYKDGKNPQSATIGEFKIYNTDGECVFKCYSVENGGESTDTPNLDKRIIARDYKLYWTESYSVTLPSEYKPQCISLYTDELPNFKKRRIHIHIGNYPQDTAGCLLLCDSWDGRNGYALQSRKATKRFYDFVKEYDISDFTLTIKEINAI